MLRSSRWALPVLCLFVALPADAAIVATSFVELAEDESLSCHAVNVGTKPVQVTIRAQRISPNPFASVSGSAIEPRTGLSASQSANIDGVQIYCEFEISGSSKSIRAVGIKLRVDGSEAAVLPAQ